MFVNPSEGHAMSASLVHDAIGLDALSAAVEKSLRQIPPAWPLAATVAVNPFLGQSNMPFAMAGMRLSRISGARLTMPRHWYREQLAAGVISDEDLARARAEAPAQFQLASITDIKSALAKEDADITPLPTVADLAKASGGTDWPAFIIERIGAWAGSYFDEGQALWQGAKGTSPYATWRAYASHDLTPEIHGLKGFANYVDTMPATAHDAIAVAAEKLKLTAEALDSYFHQLLLGLGGWSQYARYKLWQAELKNGTDVTLRDMLAIRIVWDAALFERFNTSLQATWSETIKAHAAPIVPDSDSAVDFILQDAYDRAAQRKLAHTLSKTSATPKSTRPALQAVFCIDVRSEVFRRALESLSSNIQTIGFAGFFGLTIAHKRFASDIEEARLPVLLNAAHLTCAGTAEDAATDQVTRFKRRAKRAWGRFKLAAVSSFAFVEAAGPVYAHKLVVDGLALHKAKRVHEPAPRFAHALDRDALAKTAAGILRAMSLTSGFGRLVLLIGHGADVVNNPHASALHCGACGGYSGEVNARMLAALLNDAEVRQDLVDMGISIPSDTLFVGGLHSTTTDDIALFETEHATAQHSADLVQAKAWLRAAGDLARAERAVRLPHAKSGSALYRRARDWAEIRPEWGLAGCSAFIAAPRGRTASKKLDGRTFLHEYEWRKDDGFGILELIMTAPVVVASWISLQYYGSTVAPDVFGAGNKLLHNVVGGLGVLEGNGGALRAGLPWQSVHDGKRYIHEPLRLTVCVEAPREAISNVLDKHPEVRALFENGWLHLYVLDENGCMAWRYRDGTWVDA